MKKTLILLLAALLAASCVEPLSPWHGGDGPIAFAVTADGGTKALDVTTGNVAAFDCSAYPAATTAAPYFSGVTFTANAARTFSSATPWYWPASGALDFYAWTAGAATGQVTATDYRTFTVTPSASPATQADLAVACATALTRSASTAGVVPLNFRHAGAKVAVRVRNSAAGLAFTVTGWKAGYLDASATYTHPAGASTSGSGTLPSSAWSANASPSADVTYVSDFTAAPVAVAPSADIPVSLAGEMILIPQTVPAASAYASSAVGAAVNGAYIALEIAIARINGDPVHAKVWAIWPAPISWAPGMCYTYTVDLAGGGYYETNQDDNPVLDPVIPNGYAVLAEVAVTPWNTSSLSKQAGINHIHITGEAVDSYSVAYDFSALSEIYWRPDADSPYELLTPVGGHWGSAYDLLRSDGGYLTLSYDGVHHEARLWTLDTQALTVVMRGDGTASLSYKGVAEMSVNGGAWESYAPVEAVAGDRIRYRCVPGTSGCKITVTAPFDVEGNILSLLDTRFEDVKALNTFQEERQLNGLFQSQPVVDASRLVMPSFTASECFSYMFSGCSRLEKAPQLPAATLTYSCYKNMFYSCSRLEQAPRLEAKLLATDCYDGMFQGCRRLSHIEMTATGLVDGLEGTLEDQMTDWVSGVAATGTFVKDPATTITVDSGSGIPVGWSGASLGHLTLLPSAMGYLTYSGPNDLLWSRDGVTWTTYSSPVTVAYGDRILLKGSSASWDGCTIDCTSAYTLSGDVMSLVAGDAFATATLTETHALAGLFAGSETLHDASKLTLPSTLTASCMARMFEGCTNLSAPPALPATALASGCYQDMFRGCTSLAMTPELPAATLAPYCYAGMFYGCSVLSTIIMYATDYSAEGALSAWVHGVAETGGFTAPAATYAGLPDGDDGVPTGWRDGGMTDTPFTIVAREAGTLYINVLVPTTAASFNAGINVECRVNGGEWTGVQNVFTWVDKVTGVNANACRCSTDLLAGDEISFRTTVDRRSSSGSGYGAHWYAGDRTSTFDYSGTFDVKGNIASLVCSGDFGSRGASYNQTISFTNFLKETKVVDASKLILPFLTMYDNNEYKSFFHDCAQLLKAPQTLPAMTLKGTCYRNFCLGCSLLVEGPRIMATTRNGNNFQQMFYDCASLKSVYCMISSYNANAFTNWMYGVPSGGTIILNAAISMPSGAGGIPSGWTAKYINP